MDKRIVLVDLDGVLNFYTGDYVEDYIPPLREGAREFITELSLKYNLKLFTTRNCETAKQWLVVNNLDKYFSEVTNTKKTAWLVIDDRCLTFKGDYTDTLNQIEKFKPWYKN